METKTLIGLLVAVVVVGGGVWYFSSQNAVAPSEEGATGVFETQDAAEGTGTLAELMMRTGSYRCTVNVATDGETGAAQTAGTVYIGGGKMRGDFTTNTTGMQIASHMMSMDGYVYTWSDMMPQGMKMMITTDGSSSGTQGAVDASASVDYHCAPWAIEADRFTLPSNITFTTFGEVR